jgi:hypothetical protein
LSIEKPLGSGSASILNDQQENVYFVDDGNNHLVGFSHDNAGNTLSGRKPVYIRGLNGVRG